MIHLRLLGRVQLERDGEAVTGRAGQRHPLALLGLLATAPGHAMSRDKLLAYLWPDHATRAARHRLSVILHVLRKELGKESLRNHADAVILDRSRLWVDVIRYAEAVEEGDLAVAVEQYVGPFMDGFFLPGVHEFDLWLETERRRLEALQAGTLEQLAREASARGDAATATYLWRRLGTLRPSSARIALAGARYLEEVGDRTDALTLLRVHILHVKSELGVAPDPEVLAAAERVAATPEAVPEAAAEVGKQVPAASSDATSGPTSEANDSADPRHPWRMALSGAAVMALVTGLTGGLLLTDPGPGSTVPTSTRLALEPVRVVDGDPTGARIASGLAPEVAELLSPVPGVEVGPGAAFVSFPAHGTDSLSGPLHLRSSLRTTDQGFALEASLVGPSGVEALWTGRHRAARGPPEVVRDELSLALAIDLRERLAPPRPRQHTASRTARELYLEARWTHRKWARPEVWKALQSYDEAIRYDSAFALAYAMKADAYLKLARTDGDPRPSVELAREAARRAIELDPSLADGHVALGGLQLWWDWNFSEARRSLRRALVLDPAMAQARAIYAGYLLRVEVRPDAALRHWRKALELEPLNAARSHGIERGLYFSRRYEDLLEQHQVTRSLSSDIEWKPGAPLANALRELGRYEEAEAAYLRAREWTGGPAHTGLGILYARTGRVDEALAVARAYADAHAGQHHRDVASIHAALGDVDRAMELLEEAYRIRSQKLVHLLVDPALDPLRSDPRFQDLLRRIGLVGSG